VTVDRSGQIKVSKTYHNLEPHKRLLGKRVGEHLLERLGAGSASAVSEQSANARPVEVHT
jgi:hypothetical protein